MAIRPFESDHCSGSTGLIEAGIHKMVAYRSHFVPFSQSGFSYLTCYSYQELSFSMYLKPFTTEVWIILFVAFVATTLALILVKFPASPTKIPFAVASVLLGEDFPFNPPSRSQNSYRIVFGIWLLLVPTILTNTYIGKVIQDISMPLPRNIVNTFEDILKTNCSTLTECVKEFKDYRLNMTKNGMFKIIDQPIRLDRDDFELHQYHDRDKNNLYYYNYIFGLRALWKLQ